MVPPLNQGVKPNLWIWSLQVLSPLCWVFQLMSSLLGPGNLLLPWHLGLSSGYSQFPIPHCYIFLFNFLTLCTFFPVSSHTPDPVPLFFAFLSFVVSALLCSFEPYHTRELFTKVPSTVTQFSIVVSPSMLCGMTRIFISSHGDNISHRSNFRMYLGSLQGKHVR